MEEPIPVKVVLLGESGVGKTSIIKQYTEKVYNPKVKPSITAQFVSKNLSFPDYNKNLKFDIWDTVGQEKYRSMSKIFYKDAKIIIFVYDITDLSSFEAIKDYWYKEAYNNGESEPVFGVVANKSDLYENEKVSKKDGQAFADEINGIFQSTTALSQEGINLLFENLGKVFIDPKFDYKNKNYKYESNDKDVKDDKDNLKKKEDKKKLKLIRIIIMGIKTKKKRKNVVEFYNIIFPSYQLMMYFISY